MTSQSLRGRWTIATVALTVAMHLFGAPRLGAQQPRSNGLFRDLPPGARAAAAPDSRALRARHVAIDLDRIPDARELLLNLFDDTVYRARLDRVDRTPTGYVWVGRLADVERSSVTLSVEDGVMSGSVVTAGTSYELRYAAPGIHRVAQVDQSKYPSELPPLVPQPRAARAGDAAAQTDAVTAGAQFDDGATIDVMVLYTPAVVGSLGGDAAARTLVNLAISETNTSYANSGITQRLRLAYTGQVPYVESGDMSLDLTNVTSGVGALNGVAALRNTYAADLVSLWVRYNPAPACGVGWLMTGIGAGFAPNGYNVVENGCVSPNYTFAHEMGHNMGARHDWFVDSGATVMPRSYAHGFVNTGAQWRTIMAYNDQCAAVGSYCSRLLYWASPNRLAPSPYAPTPMGVPAGTSTRCSNYSTANPPCDADDARLLNETAFVVANFRQAPASPVAVTSLVPNTPSPALLGTAVTWTANVSGGTAPITYKFLVYDGASWTIGRDWSTSNNWTWAPGLTGDYSVQVWVRNAASSALYDAWSAASFVIHPPPLQVTAVTASFASGTAPVGMNVVWTAATSGGTAPFTYKFLVFDGANWSVGRDWNASNSWSWTPPAPGHYALQVWARNAGSSALYDAWNESGPYNVPEPPPIRVRGLSPSPGSGVPAGTPITWTAAAEGGTAPYTYKFLLWNGSTWTIGRDWSGLASWTWTPSIPGSYAVQVWVRNAGSSAVYDAWVSYPTAFAVSAQAPLSVTSVTASPASTAPLGAGIQWTAAASGGAGPYTYKFLLFDGATWSVGQDWSGASTWSWLPPAAGTYVVQVWVRNAGSPATYDAWRSSAPFTVTATADARTNFLSAQEPFEHPHYSIHVSFLHPQP